MLMKKQDLIDALERCDGVQTEAAKLLGLTRSGFRWQCQKHGINPTQTSDIIEIAEVPDDDVPIEELIEQRKRKFERKYEYETARKLIPVKVKIPGTIGILHFGDPHVDDDGTDIVALERHMALTRDIEGLFAGNIGDTTNNWIGRLARLYGEQSTSTDQAWKLAEWFITGVEWLYIIAGNHDLWSGTGDPIKWIAKYSGQPYTPSEVRMELRFTKGLPVRINARHDFSGNSIWNPAHGPSKALQMGARDHIAICGHKNKSGYAVLKDSNTGIVMHGIQVGSYKIFDRFAMERGFRDQSLGPSCVTTIDPDLPDTSPDKIKVWWDAEEGADYLKWKRNRA